VSLNISVGYTGLLTLSHAGFYGVGAYAVALLTTEADMNFYLAMVIGMLAAGFVALLVSPILRLKGHFFILATVAVQLMLTQILFNWISLTKGALGVIGIPSPTLFGYKLNDPQSFLFLSIPVALLVILVVRQLVDSPYGRVLKAIRANPEVAESVGINVQLYRLRVMIITAMLAAVAGGLWAGYSRYVSPGSFSILFSTTILVMVILGGSGRWIGSVIGAAMLIAITEAVRFMPGIPADIIGSVQVMVWSGTLFAAMLWRPQGLVGSFKME
jgi:branched-chain amino acid transport system permease protein